MSVRNPLRLGVIGCGRATRRLHLPALRRVDGIEVVALADPDPEALGAAAEPFRNAVRYADHRDLLDDENVQAVAVCVPASLHEPVGVAALESGKHLFIEKPLALDLDACDRLIAAAANGKLQVLVGFNLRHHRLVREAADCLRAGGVGAVEAVRSTWTSAIRRRQGVPAWRDRRASGGGALFEIAVHHVDLWRFLLESEVQAVCATGRSRETEDETVVIAATLSNGTVVSAVFSERSADENNLVMYGTEGRLALSPFRFDGFDVHRIDQADAGLRGRLQRLAGLARGLPKGIVESRLGGVFRTSYDREWEHFRDAVSDGRPPSAGLEDGRRAVQVVLAAIESAEAGRWVDVSTAPRKVVS